MRRKLDAAEFRALFDDYRRSAWRWEQQPVYASDLANGWPGRWLAGERKPTPHRQAWADHIRRLVETGRTMERVRVIDEPETDYQRWAEWSADINRSGGEVIHRIIRSEADRLGLTYEPVEFWLFDDELVVWLTFDDEYELVAVDTDDSADGLTRACQVRDLAMEAVSTNAR